MMRRITRFSLAALVVGAAITQSAHGVMISSRGDWEAAVGTWAAVDENQIPIGQNELVGGQITLPSTATLTFGTPLIGGQVPDDWQTWSGGNTPRVLIALGNFVDPTSLTAISSSPLNSFGLELQPNDFADFDMTLLLSNGSTVTMNVNGDGGAAFFGWVNESVLGFSISTPDSSGFAFGRMVEGPGSPTPSVPEGGSVTFLLGLVCFGLTFIKNRLLGEQTGIA